MWEFDFMSFMLGTLWGVVATVSGIVVGSAIGWANRGGGEFPPRV